MSPVKGSSSLQGLGGKQFIPAKLDSDNDEESSSDSSDRDSKDREEESSKSSDSSEDAQSTDNDSDKDGDKKDTDEESSSDSSDSDSKDREEESSKSSDSSVEEDAQSKEPPQVTQLGRGKILNLNIKKPAKKNKNQEDGYDDEDCDDGRKRAKHDNDSDKDGDAGNPVQPKYPILSHQTRVVIIPCLLLYDRNDFTVIQCEWNMRNVDFARLDGDDGLVAKLHQENSDVGPSTLQGDSFLCAVTSFRVCSEEVEKCPLTLNIVKDAILWTTGEEAGDSDDLVSLITTFMESLEAISKGNVQEMKRFIAEHNWDDSQADSIAGLQNLPDEDKSCVELWKFIKINLAWETKILANMLDCQHRVVALDKVLETDFEKYSNTCVQLRCIVVEEKNFSGGNLDSEMKSLSALSQHTSGKQESYGLREFLPILMQSLDTKCNGEGYLCNVGFDRILQTYPAVSRFNKRLTLEGALNEVSSSAEILPDTRDLTPNKIPFFFVQCWIAKMSKLIEQVLEGTEAMMIFLEDEGVNWSQVKANWNWLFQPKTKGKGDGEYKYLFGNYDYTLHHFMKGGDIYRRNRYPGGLPDLVVEIVQLLLWSQLSKETHTTLLNLFQSCCTRKVTKKEVSRQISCWFHSITAAVYYSSKVWERVLHLGDRQKFLDKQVLSFFLLMSAIEQNTPFFAQLGPNPTFPPRHETAMTRLRTIWDREENIYPSLEDLLSFVTVFHVCHMAMHTQKITTDLCKQHVGDTANLSLKKCSSLKTLRGSVSIINNIVGKSKLTARAQQYYDKFLVDTADVVIEIRRTCTGVTNQRSSEEDETANKDESDDDDDDDDSEESAFAHENEGGREKTTTSFNAEESLLSALDDLAKFVTEKEEILSSFCSKETCISIKESLGNAVNSLHADNNSIEKFSFLFGEDQKECQDQDEIYGLI